MTMIWKRHINGGIVREVGYDFLEERLTVVFTDNARKHYAPVTYGEFTNIRAATYPEREYRRTIADNKPQVLVTEY